eukprot:1181446-Prorocentrum_minimum.AAC.1
MEKYGEIRKWLAARHDVTERLRGGEVGAVGIPSRAVDEVVHVALHIHNETVGLQRLNLRGTRGYKGGTRGRGYLGGRWGEGASAPPDRWPSAPLPARPRGLPFIYYMVYLSILYYTPPARSPSAPPPARPRAPPVKAYIPRIYTSVQKSPYRGIPPYKHYQLWSYSSTSTSRVYFDRVLAHVLLRQFYHEL